MFNAGLGIKKAPLEIEQRTGKRSSETRHHQTIPPTS